MLLIVAGEYLMKAKEFNQRYPVGSTFIYQPNPLLRGGKVVSTVESARDCKDVSVVEINLEPYFANIKSLIPAG